MFRPPDMNPLLMAFRHNHTRRMNAPSEAGGIRLESRLRSLVAQNGRVWGRMV